MSIIEVKNINRGFGPGHGGIEVLKDLSLSVEKGTFNLLLGPSGSGKTTLLNILGTLDQPDSGQVWVYGDDITTYSDNQRNALRKTGMGYIFQSVALISNMSAYENVDFFLRINKINYQERERRILECLKFVGLDKRMHHKPSEMSGGEQQRVAIARAISHRPELLLADEPTGELDTATGLKVVHMFKKMVEDTGTTIIMCTHDRNLIHFADHIFEMEDGVIING
jgi:putative ABC transport system ATP-binding protein